MRMHNPAHPGAVLKDALSGLNWTVSQMAAYIGVSRNTLSRIVNQRGGVTPEISMRLSEAFGQSQPDIWFLMQNQYEFWQASQAKRKPLKSIPVRQQAA